MLTLTIQEPGRVAARVAAADGMVFARDPTCDLVLANRSVSRRHARLYATGDGWHIADVGSTHGTQVNGRRVEDAAVGAATAIHLGSVLIELDDRHITRDELTIGPPLPELEARELAPEARRLGILFELSRAVGDRVGIDELVGKVLGAVLDAFGCERGVVELHTGGAVRRITRGAERLVVSRAVQAALLERGERVLVHGAAVDEVASLAKHGVRAAMGAPLASGSRRLGFIYVDDRTHVDRFPAPSSTS